MRQSKLGFSRYLAPALLLFAFSIVAFAQDRGPSTPEERERLVLIAESFTRDPLNPQLQPDRVWAKDFVIAVPDIQVTYCSVVMGPLSYNTDYSYKKLLQDVNLLGQAAFVIRHPDESSQTSQLAYAGISAMLTAYESIVAKDPRARWRELDELLAIRNQNRLKSHILHSKGACGTSGIL